MSEKINKKNIIDEDISIPIADKLITKDIEKKNYELLNKVKLSVPLDKHIEWYDNEYMKQWQFNKTPNIAKAKIHSRNGSVIRMQNITAMKYTFQYNTMDMIIAVMKLYDYSTKKETNYGSLFCELASVITPIRLESLVGKTDHGNVLFTFYSATPSYISCDGEYRSQFSKYHSIINTKKTYPDIWMELDEYVNRIKLRRQWSPYVSYFYPKLEQERHNTEVEFAVKNELAPNTILIIAWFNAIFDEMLGLTKTHVNENFKDVFLKEKDVDINFMKELIKKYGETQVDAFRASIYQISKNFQQSSNRYLQCGYKMIPLNIKEVQDPLRLRYKPWREYFISNKCNDLVINSISCFNPHACV
jgi:hypothetical protein